MKEITIADVITTKVSDFVTYKDMPVGITQFGPVYCEDGEWKLIPPGTEIRMTTVASDCVTTVDIGHAG